MNIIDYIRNLFNKKRKEIKVENMWDDYHDRGIIGDESYNLIKQNDVLK